jgi:transcription initiation factor TFIID TATA-box-binding protein
MPKPKIVNIVGSGHLSEKLNLDTLTCKLEKHDVEDIEYEPERYPGLLLKIKNPRAHITLYSTGKYIILGVTNEEDLEKAYMHLIKLLKEVKNL